jgi:hypothetical protein
MRALERVSAVLVVSAAGEFIGAVLQSLPSLSGPTELLVLVIAAQYGLAVLSIFAEVGWDLHEDSVRRMIREEMMKK